MNELKLEKFFEKDKSGHVVRKGDLDLLLLYIATKVDEIVRHIHENGKIRLYKHHSSPDTTYSKMLKTCLLVYLNSKT